MNVTMVPTTHAMSNAMATIIAAATPAVTYMAAAKVGLGTGVITPTPSTTFSACVEATFTGYAESATVVWGLPINETDGSVTCWGPSNLFRCTGSGTPNAIANLFYTDGVASPNTGVCFVGSIFPPIEIVNSGDGFSVTPGFNSLFDDTLAVIAQ